MDRKPSVTEAFTVRHSPQFYAVLDPQGQLVSRYFYDADEFSDRRRAYREALEDAEVRNTVAARQEQGAPTSSPDRMAFLYGAQAPLWTDGVAR